jgi:hypothetical protein
MCAADTDTAARRTRVQVAAAFVRAGAEDGVKMTGVAGSGVGATVDAVTADAAGVVLRHTLTAMGPYVRCKTGVIGENTHLFSLLPLPPPTSPPSPELDGDGDGAAAGGGGGVLALLTKQMTLLVRLGTSMQVPCLHAPAPHPHALNIRTLHRAARRYLSQHPGARPSPLYARPPSGPESSAHVCLPSACGRCPRRGHWRV